MKLAFSLFPKYIVALTLHDCCAAQAEEFDKFEPMEDQGGDTPSRCQRGSAGRTIDHGGHDRLEVEEDEDEEEEVRFVRRHKSCCISHVEYREQEGRSWCCAGYVGLSRVDIR